MNENIVAKKNHRNGVLPYYISLAISIILLYVINNIRYMNISYFTDKLTSCLWAINLALTIGILGNFILLLYRPIWFQHVTQIVINGLSIFAVYIVYQEFPFNLTGETLHTGVTASLFAIMAALAIGTLLELVQMIIQIVKTRTPPPISPTP